MPDKRLPKICLVRLFALAEAPGASVKYNWACQIREFLAATGALDLWQNLSPLAWKSRTVAVLASYERLLRFNDELDRDSLNSTRQLVTVARPAISNSYLYNNCSLAMTRLKAQVRLANDHNCRFVFNGHAYYLFPKELCSVCNLNEPESLEHFLCICPHYLGLRSHYLGEFLTGRLDLGRFLNDPGPASTKALFYFMTNALCLRAFLRNE